MKLIVISLWNIKKLHSIKVIPEMRVVIVGNITYSPLLLRGTWMTLTCPNLQWLSLSLWVRHSIKHIRQKKSPFSWGQSSSGISSTIGTSASAEVAIHWKGQSNFDWHEGNLSCLSSKFLSRLTDRFSLTGVVHWVVTMTGGSSLLQWVVVLVVCGVGT